MKELIAEFGENIIRWNKDYYGWVQFSVFFGALLLWTSTPSLLAGGARDAAVAATGITWAGIILTLYATGTKRIDEAMDGFVQEATTGAQQDQIARLWALIRDQNHVISSLERQLREAINA